MSALAKSRFHLAAAAVSFFLECHAFHAFDVNMMGNESRACQPEHVRRVAHPECLRHGLRGIENCFFPNSQVRQAGLFRRRADAALADERVPAKLVLCPEVVQHGFRLRCSTPRSNDGTHGAITRREDPTQAPCDRFVHHVFAWHRRAAIELTRDKRVLLFLCTRAQFGVCPSAERGQLRSILDLLRGTAFEQLLNVFPGRNLPELELPEVDMASGAVIRSRTQKSR